MIDTVRTEAELLDLFRDGQGNQQLTAQDMRDFIVSSKYLNGQGWEFHIDGTYTAGARRTILGGNREQITIDGAASDIGHPAVTHALGHFWDTTTNQVNATALNNFAIGRVAFVGASVGGGDNRFEFEVDVTAGLFPIIFQETGVFAKGTADQNFNFIVPLFVGPEFLANGARGFLTPENDATFHTFAITIVRIHLARP